ncbi:uncharacterized protein [Haliotis cracherodii]|uniref:uncharacterized protein n=1 Tax=Haliotis cracherodii TaxID=6455 RepID=UPI0039EBE2C9
MATVADLASYRDIPVFGWVSSTIGLDNKDRFSTLIRVLPPLSSLGSIFVSFCRNLGWLNVVMMSTEGLYTRQLAASMLYTFNSDNNTDFSLVRHYYNIPLSASDALLVKHFKKIKTEARV